jgi:hypothetical protein
MIKFSVLFAAYFFNYIFIKYLIIVHNIASIKSDTQKNNLWVILVYWLLSPITVFISFLSISFSKFRYNTVLFIDMYGKSAGKIQNILNSVSRKIFFS